MKRLTIAALLITLATSAEARWHLPWNKPAAASPTDPLHKVIAQVTGSAPTDPLTVEVSPLDHIVRTVLSPTFVEHANKSLAMAGTTDPMFTQCVQFGLTIRQEIIDKPLIDKPTSALATVDLTCPLCVIEAQRQDFEAVQSGALAARVSDLRLRVRTIKKRAAMACGPLKMDQEDIAGQAFDFIGGLLGH